MNPHFSEDGQWVWDAENNAWLLAHSAGVPNSAPEHWPPTPRRGRRWWILAGVGVVAAVGVTVVLSLGGGSGNPAETTDAGQASPALSKSQTCAVELNTILDISYDAYNVGEYPPSDIANTVGIENSLYAIVNGPLLGDFVHRSLTGGGVDAAEQEIGPVIAQDCEDAGNPILTKAEVEALTPVASPGDIDQLQQVTLYRK